MSWPLVKMGEIFDIARGGSPRPIDDYITDAENGINWIMIGDTKDGSKYIEKTAKKIKPEGLKKTRRVNEGDFLLTNSMSFGRPYILKTSGCIHDGWLALSPRSDQIHKDYFYYYLGSAEIKHKLLGKAAGAVVKNLNKEIVQQLEVPLPPLDEQKRTAEILDKADAIRRKRQQAIQLADDFLKSVFLDMFGDPLDPNSKVETLPMTEVFKITTGKLNSNAAVENGKYPFFTCAKEVFFIDEYSFDQEALLLAGNNAQADYDVKHYVGKFNAYQRTYVLTLKDDKYSYPFFKFALEYQLQNLKRFSKGSNTKYITMEIMERTLLPIPETRLQSEFVDYFKKYQQLYSKYAHQLSESQRNFNSLSQKAFAGEL